MSAKIVPVIMAGGKGTRLWPLSRSSAPKQFMQVINDQSLFQKTLLRISDQSRYTPAIVVTNSEFRFLVAEQAQSVGAALATVLLEPVARNTAAALAAAALIAKRDYGDDAILQVLASDHEIDSGALYFECIDRAFETAKAGHLVTFGITPTEPATGYGYIEQGAPLETGAYSVARFVEKPNQARAVELLASGGFLWNSGMFMLPVGLFLQEMQQFAAAVCEAVKLSLDKATIDLDFTRLDAAAFSQAPDISVDYAVFEHTQHAAVVPSSFSWSDLGSWDSVWAIGAKDENGNVVGQKVSVSNTHNSLILSRDIHLAVNGVQDMAIIASEDAVYVGRLVDSQDVGQIVKQLAKSAATRSLTEVHPTSYRPWGAVASVLSGERFEVKRLYVAPGRKISLQKHFHRSEHWIVVRGTAEITLEGETRLLHENESIYIPQGQVHRLSNPGRIPLELIEVQTGSYLQDDDVLRLDDEFGRIG